MQRASGGDPLATSELASLLYRNLRRMADAQLSRCSAGDTLRPTALVHEAYLRLHGAEDPGWSGHAHFLGAAARAMRRVVSNYARAKLAAKRGGRRAGREPIADVEIELGAPVEDVVALDEALDLLERQRPRQAQIVTLRYFADLDEDQIATVIGVSTRTVRRDWNLARLFLAKAFGVGES